VLGMTLRERPDLNSGRMPGWHFLLDEPCSQQGTKLPCYSGRSVQCLGMGKDAEHGSADLTDLVIERWQDKLLFVRLEDW
jgi:hypothetical protein